MIDPRRAQLSFAARAQQHVRSAASEKLRSHRGT
jgi:hypothetical protein